MHTATSVRRIAAQCMLQLTFGACPAVLLRDDDEGLDGALSAVRGGGGLELAGRASGGGVCTAAAAGTVSGPVCWSLLLLCPFMFE